MHSQIRIQIANRQCQCWMCQTGTALSPLDADMDRNTAAVGHYGSCCYPVPCACVRVQMLAVPFKLASHGQCRPSGLTESGTHDWLMGSPWNSQGYSLLAFRWTRSKSRFPVFSKHCIQPLIAFVLISGFERRIVESRFCFHIVNARISQYSYLKSGVVHLKAPVQTSYWITW